MGQAKSSGNSRPGTSKAESGNRDGNKPGCVKDAPRGIESFRRLTDKHAEYWYAVLGERPTHLCFDYHGRIVIKGDGMPGVFQHNDSRVSMADLATVIDHHTHKVMQ